MSTWSLVPTHKEMLVDEMEHGMRLARAGVGSLDPELCPGAVRKNGRELWLHE